MALIKCPECGNMISDRAATCPRCGCPTTGDNQHVYNHDMIPKETESSSVKKPLYAIIALLIVALALVGVWLLRSKASDDSNQVAVAADSIAQQNAPAATEAAPVNLDGTHHFKGKIGKYPIEMRLSIDGHSVTGLSHYDSQKRGVNMTIDGSCDDSGKLSLSEYDSDGMYTDNLVGVFRDGKFTGTFRNVHKNSRLDFALYSAASTPGIVEANEVAYNEPEELTEDENFYIQAQRMHERAMQQEKEEAAEARNTSSYSNSSSSSSFRFTTAHDVIGYLADKSFYNGGRRLRIRPEGVWFNNLCATGAPYVLRFESSRAIVRAVSTMGPTYSYTIDTDDNTVTDDTGDVFRLR